jgi:signal transduction histidine kinase
MADAVVMVDPAGRIALTNAAFRAMFPVPFQPVDAHGQPIPDEATPWAAAARGDPCEMEFMVQDPDGTQRWFEATGRPIDGGPGAQGGAAVIRDITDRSIHRLQEEFMSVASHELRGPLTVLNGYLTMLQRSLSGEIDAERLRSYLDQARHQTERLQILVRDLVDVTRLQQGKISLQLGPVDAAEVAKQAVAAARQIAPGSPIEAQLPEEPVTVRGDATRLEQVLLNLLTNATTYAGDSGPIELSLTARDGEAAMTISDRGPGIPPEDLPHLFGRFYTGANQGREGGLGLGLYISRELVDAMDGSISVESEIGKGSAFTVTLPLADV